MVCRGMKNIFCFLVFLCGICVTYAGRADDWYSKYDMFRRSCESTDDADNTEAINCCIQQNFFQTTWTGTQCNCTVGGQPIADWGDTFNVGLRR